MTTLSLDKSPAPERVNIYPGPSPGSLGQHRDIDNPFLLLYLPATPIEGGAPAIMICPGGGYVNLSMDYEGTTAAKWFQARGVAAFVLRYRLPGQDYPHPAPLQDAQRAMRLIRSHAADWGIDPHRLGVMGFSAGGHLAATLETHDDAGNSTATDPIDRLSCRPDFAVLVYALISMQERIAHQGSKRVLLGPDPDPKLVDLLSNEMQVTPQTPPTLLIHAKDDPTVLLAHSELMLAALQKAGVTSALHEYPVGGHGFGLQQPVERPPVGWLDAAAKWLQEQKLLTLVPPTP